MDKILTVELIKAAVGIVQALIPTIGGIFVGNRMIKNKVLIEQLKTALTDLNTMYHIEAFYCEIHRNEKSIGKTTVRRNVKEGLGFSLSGKFPKSRIEKKLASLNKQ